MQNGGLPLQGIKVLDFSQAILGPVCARLLADLGADVIKVEPLEGDFSRLTGEPGIDSITFMVSNLNKRSLALNLKDSRGIEIALNLARTADVLIENFRPGAMRKLGLGYEELAKTNPGLVYASLSMYGETGPLARRRGGDIWAQAFTGIVESQGSPDSPSLIGHALIDAAGAVTGAFAVMVALFERAKTGIGREVSTNLVNVSVLLQWPAIAHYLVEGVNLKRAGRGGVRWLFPHGAYTAKDGDVVTIHGQDDDEWRTICSILGIEHLLDEPKYDTPQKRDEHKFELYPVLDQAFRKRTRAEWEQIFRQHRLRCDGCLDYAEFIAHPQFQENNLAVEVNDPREGKILMPASPIQLQGIEPAKSYDHAPILGEHSREILLGLGYSEQQVAELNEQGVIGIPSPEMFQVKRQHHGRGGTPLVRFK
ncbi:CaiB/BaiF CoA transferase family protein [Chloroflexota bacterium]